MLLPASLLSLQRLDKAEPGTFLLSSPRYSEIAPALVFSLGKECYRATFKGGEIMAQGTNSDAIVLITPPPELRVDPASGFWARNEHPSPGDAVMIQGHGWGFSVGEDEHYRRTIYVTLAGQTVDNAHPNDVVAFRQWSLLLNVPGEDRPFEWFVRPPAPAS